jgi:hypothetical protein
MWQPITGIVLLAIGLFFSSFNKRPFMDYDFILTWYGFLFLTDFLAFKLTGKSIFRSLKLFLILAFSSSIFWTFYEWLNLFLKNWAYPAQILYNQLEWEVLTVIAFATVLPHLIISTNIIKGIFFKNPISFSQSKLSKPVIMTSIVLGFICLALTVYVPIYFFPLAWFIVFLILDPINSIYGRRSLISQILKRNWRPLILLSTAAILAGFWWETINFFVHRWIYPIVPWFWTLPAPITTKYIEMPLAGFLGYIPFILSAFAFVEFLEIPLWFKQSKD